MRSGLVDDTLGAVLDKILEKLEGLVDLAPLFGRLFGKAAVDHGHDLVESLAVFRVSHVRKHAVFESVSAANTY